ncbi:PREDICTED: uncharacterized protein LOC108361007 [Rhagoletis zephyria]|uniref:uncharacterized protein LOC108361007 n=1 Tax=Rhagoletis zephyria TaxID=28612 RepID=UPI00081150C0|nr:PREDICTED: uncharacterized protein LOC108361007 [Rhagoletis zephyria]
MLAHADEYEILRKLESLDENLTDRTDRLKLIRKSLQESIKKAFENSSKRYHFRSTVKTFNVGDIVYRRNVVLSDAIKRFCAKLALKFLKAKVIAVKSNYMYELEDDANKKRAVYHGKDIIEGKGGHNTAPTI